jgi:pimeloyl-ACP methyl ester carboxylesterase
MASQGKKGERRRFAGCPTNSGKLMCRGTSRSSTSAAAAGARPTRSRAKTPPGTSWPTPSASARAWSVWEGTTSELRVDPDAIARFGSEEFADAFARIEAHYFVHRTWLRSDPQLLDDAARIAEIPGVIVQGRYDVVCPAASAWALHERWPGWRLVIDPDAGHSIKEPGIVSELVQATEDFAML